MDLGKALTYPFKDTKKVFQTGLITIIPLFGLLAFMGYFVTIIRRVAAGDDERLPDWGDFGTYVKQGIVSWAALFLYAIPAIMIVKARTDGTSSSTYITGIIVAFPLGIFYTLALLRYAAEERVISFLEFGRNIGILLRHMDKVIGAYIVIFSLQLAATVFTYVSAIGVITICLGFYASAYGAIASAYLLGTLARRLNLDLQQDQVFVPVMRQEVKPVQIEAPRTQHIIEEHRNSSTQTTTISTVAPTSAVAVNSTYDGPIDNIIVYSIQVPQTTKFEPEKAESLIKQILTQVQDVIFVIVADHKQIAWQIWDFRQGHNPDFIQQGVKNAYPQADVILSNMVLPTYTGPFWRDIIVYQQHEYFVCPIKYVTELTKLDPLTQLVQGMSELQEGERITQMLYAPSFVGDQEIKAAYNKITRSNWHPSLDISSLEGAVGSLVGSTFSAAFASREGRFEPGHQKIYEDKLYNHLLVNCYLITQFDFLDRSRVSKGLGLQPSMFQFHGEENAIAYSEDLSYFKPVYVESAAMDKKTSGLGILNSWITGSDQRQWKAKAVLSTYEIASLWHLPYEGFSAPEITWKDRTLPPKGLIESQEGIVIGDTDMAGVKRPIRIHPEDRETHMYVIGKTGMGKSTLLHNCIHQDIQSGKGVGILDPHEKLISDILKFSIPDERIDDVVVLDIANIDYPVPLNPLQAPGDDDVYAASEIVAILETIEGNLGVQVAHSLNSAFVTIRREKQATVRDVVRLYRDPEYRYQFINQSFDPITQDYWEDYEAMSPGQQDKLKIPIMHRMGRFYRNPIVYFMMCHPQPLNFRELIDQKKIVLMSLRIGEDKVPPLERRLVGTTLVKQFQMAAMSTLQQREYYLYIDEVQDFITAPLDVILEQARKFGLRLNYANQYLGQLGNILPSLIGNTGTTAVFEVGQDDATKLARYFDPRFTRSDLENMGRFHAAVKTRYLGNTTPAFKVATRPRPTDLFNFGPDSAAAKQREQMIRQRSIANYTPMTREEVKAWLDERYPKKTFTTPSRPNDEDVDWRVTGDDE